MKSKLVSIIVPLYNSERFIMECINSCIKQTYDNVEVVVVDDGSTDNSLNNAKKIIDKRVKVVHKKNGGVSSARNAGLKETMGDYVCFVDADDCLDKRFVEIMVKYMEDNDSNFCFSKNVAKEKANWNKREFHLATRAEAEELLLSQRVPVGCWNKMYRRDILEGVSFREDLFYGEGLYFINQIAHNAKNIVICEDELYFYRKVNPESATTKFDLKKMFNGEKSLLEIKKIIKDDGKRVNRMWNQHYCLFCMNAMTGILKTSNDKKEFGKWHRKMNGKVISAINSTSKLKVKLKIVIAFALPSLYKKIVK